MGIRPLEADEPRCPESERRSSLLFILFYGIIPSNMENIRKLVLPVAGMGKRLQPLTLHTPKALVNLAKKPLLEYVLREAVESGFKEAVLIISPGHEAHFEKFLEEKQNDFPELKFHIRVQKTPRGNGHALLQAADIIGNEPFAVRFPDDVIFSEKPVMRELSGIFAELKAPIFLLEQIPREETYRYGVVEIGPTPHKNVHQVFTIVEKPPVEEAPSNLTVVGGYILTPNMLDYLARLEKATPDIADALPLTRAFEQELLAGGKIYGWEFPGKRLDCGNLAGLQIAEEYIKSTNNE